MGWLATLEMQVETKLSKVQARERKRERGGEKERSVGSAMEVQAGGWVNTTGLVLRRDVDGVAVGSSRRQNAQASSLDLPRAPSSDLPYKRCQYLLPATPFSRLDSWRAARNAVARQWVDETGVADPETRRRPMALASSRLPLADALLTFSAALIGRPRKRVR